jgi:cell division septation protein DedD
VLGVILTGVRAEVSPDYEELEYYRYAYGQEPDQRDAERLRSRKHESVPGRVAGFLKSLRFSIKIVLLIVLFLLLVAALAVWFGVLPTDWMGRLAPGPGKAGTVSRVVTEEGRVASAQTSGVQEASAPPVGATPLPQPTLGAPSGARPIVASPPVEPQRQGALDSSNSPHPFSLQVASRSDPAVSMARAEALRKAGLDAFTVPADIPGKGLWYRVLVGGFGSAAKAVESGGEMRAKGLIREALVLSLPYAVEVKLATDDRPADAVALARRSGYLPILHSDGGDPATGATQILRIDAFRTEEEAKHMADILRAAGLIPRVIRR